MPMFVVVPSTIDLTPPLALHGVNLEILFDAEDSGHFVCAAHSHSQDSYSKLEFVPRKLHRLLASSVDYYPPAIALVRDEVERSGEICSKEDLLGFCAERLEFHLSNQPHSGVRLARARESDGELMQGGFYWATKSDPTRGIQWVSRDMYTYWSPGNCFDITP